MLGRVQKVFTELPVPSFMGRGSLQTQTNMSRPRITTHRSMLCSVGSKSAGVAVSPTEESSLVPGKSSTRRYCNNPNDNTSNDSICDLLPASIVPKSIFYLPLRENPEAVKEIKQTYHYPIRYVTRYLIDFFTALREEQHHIFVLLENLPSEYFVIERTYDRQLYWNNRKGTRVDGYLYPHESYSLSEFLEKQNQFHSIDDFEVTVLGRNFFDTISGILSQKELQTLYIKFLREQCERHLRLNKPIALTSKIIRQYGLTECDVLKIRPYISRYNREARKKIGDEYRNLAQLDFIRLGPEKTNTK